jgi:hypothetical protein
MNLEPLHDSEFDLNQVCRSLESEFSCVDINRKVGELRERMRLERQLEFLRQHAVPKPVLEYQKELIKKAHVAKVYQVSVYDGTPLRAVLDLTIRKDRILGYFAIEDTAAMSRCVHALQCSAKEIDLEIDVEYEDERRSSEEQLYWERRNRTQRLVTEQLRSLEGTEALFICEQGKITRIRLRDCQVDPRWFSASIEVIPTFGLQSDLRMKGICWNWGDFSAGDRIWILGPYIVQKLIFGSPVSEVVHYCANLALVADPLEHRRHLKSIIRQAMNHPLV